MLCWTASYAHVNREYDISVLNIPRLFIKKQRFTPYFRMFKVFWEIILKLPPGFEFDYCQQNHRGYCQPTTNTHISFNHLNKDLQSAYKKKNQQRHHNGQRS